MASVLPLWQLIAARGRLHRSQLYPLLLRISTYLMRWARNKYRRLRAFKRFKRWWLDLLDPRARTLRPLGLDTLVLTDWMRRAE
jgi:hypothetical protein